MASRCRTCGLIFLQGQKLNHECFALEDSGCVMTFEPVSSHELQNYIRILGKENTTIQRSEVQVPVQVSIEDQNRKKAQTVSHTFVGTEIFLYGCGGGAYAQESPTLWIGNEFRYPIVIVCNTYPTRQHITVKARFDLVKWDSSHYRRGTWPVRDGTTVTLAVKDEKGGIVSSASCTKNGESPAWNKPTKKENPFLPLRILLDEPLVHRIISQRKDLLTIDLTWQD